MDVDIVRAIKAEYDRCAHYIENPWESATLYGIDPSDHDAVKAYYSYRSEGLGFALDRLPKTPTS